MWGEDAGPELNRRLPELAVQHECAPHGGRDGKLVAAQHWQRADVLGVAYDAVVLTTHREPRERRDELDRQLADAAEMLEAFGIEDMFQAGGCAGLIGNAVLSRHRAAHGIEFLDRWRPVAETTKEAGGPV